MKKGFIITLLITLLFPLCITAANPKVEFRGAWLNTVGQGHYAKRTTAENKAYLCDQLDKLKAAGCNAIIWQVRPQADACYKSNLEPWSRWITGTAGVAPKPFWDTLEFMVEESHKRGMELHAWLNPYRVTTSKNEKLPKNHIYHKHPERFVKYEGDGKIYFDPGLPENRAFIEEVVKDIVTRYDVDAIHMDDYFYPYPVAGYDFPDAESYKKFGNGMDRGDWRRQNVNLLIEGLHKVIIETKPWVRLGISPFGVWRNKTSDPERGSETKALENYDSLYADVLLWTEQGWVDYMMPQLYWELDHTKASTEVLAYWWNKYTYNRHMYYGQSVNRTMDKPDMAPSKNPTQLDHKIHLSRSLDNVHGNCWWPGYSVTKNYKGVADSLANNHQSTIALIPSYPWIDDIKPAEVTNLKAQKNGKNIVLTWTPAKTSDKLQQHRSFVVYGFAEGEGINLNDSKAIIDVTYSSTFAVPAKHADKTTFVVTALDRACNESPKGAAVSVK